MPPSDEMTPNRRILAKIDGRLRSELDQEKGEWMVKVPASPAVRAVWKRYCDTVGVHMGYGLAVLLHHELASIADEELETLGDRLKARQSDLDSRAAELAKAEKGLERQRRDLAIRESELAERQRDL
jgi:prefoldin subunit 5